MNRRPETKLQRGLIPPHTVCPYRQECPEVDVCSHGGKDHTVAFSCGLARLFDLMQRREPVAGNG